MSIFEQPGFFKALAVFCGILCFLSAATFILVRRQIAKFGDTAYTLEWSVGLVFTTSITFGFANIFWMEGRFL